MRLATRALLAALVSLVLCAAVSAQTLQVAIETRVISLQQLAPVVQKVDQPGFLLFTTVQRSAAASSRSALPIAIMIVIQAMSISLTFR